jgi:hypothetical protein
MTLFLYSWLDLSERNNVLFRLESIILAYLLEKLGKDANKQCFINIIARKRLLD